MMISRVMMNVLESSMQRGPSHCRDRLSPGREETITFLILERKVLEILGLWILLEVRMTPRAKKVKFQAYFLVGNQSMLIFIKINFRLGKTLSLFYRSRTLKPSLLKSLKNELSPPTHLQ